MNDNDTVFEEVTGNPADTLNLLSHRLENYRLKVVRGVDFHSVHLSNDMMVSLFHCHEYYEVLTNGQQRLVAVLGFDVNGKQHAFAIPSEFE